MKRNARPIAWFGGIFIQFSHAYSSESATNVVVSLLRRFAASVSAAELHGSGSGSGLASLFRYAALSFDDNINIERIN